MTINMNTFYTIKKQNHKTRKKTKYKNVCQKYNTINLFCYLYHGLSFRKNRTWNSKICSQWVCISENMTYLFITIYRITEKFRKYILCTISILSSVAVDMWSWLVNRVHNMCGSIGFCVSDYQHLPVDVIQTHFHIIIFPAPYHFRLFFYFSVAFFIFFIFIVFFCTIFIPFPNAVTYHLYFIYSLKLKLKHTFNTNTTNHICIAYTKI